MSPNLSTRAMVSGDGPERDRRIMGEPRFPESCCKAQIKSYCRGALTPSTASSSRVGPRGAFPTVGENGMVTPSRMLDADTSPLSMTGNPPEPALLAAFWCFPGIWGSGEPVCAAVSSARRRFPPGAGSSLMATGLQAKERRIRASDSILILLNSSVLISSQRNLVVLRIPVDKSQDVPVPAPGNARIWIFFFLIKTKFR